MSSKTIYPHVPYFYIIQHIPSGKKYAGCRFAKGCNPSEFMRLGGYTTSSKIVNKLIEDDGIDSFKIIQLLPETACGIGVYEYETKFLTENNISKRIDWLNCHDNTINAIGSDAYKFFMVKLYGSENPSKIDGFKTKKKQTCLSNYGTEYFLQSDHGKFTVAETNIRLYGVANQFQNPDIKNKIKSDCLANHGVEYHQSRPEIREKISNSNKGKIRTEETCEKIREYHSGLVSARNLITGVISLIPRDEFNNSNIYVGNTKGFMVAKDASGNNHYIRTDDVRYLSGELVHTSRGTSNESAKNTAPAKDSVTGEHIGRISTYDPRWATGEIVSTSRGTSTAAKGRKTNAVSAKLTETGEKIGKVSLTDPRWNTGEIITTRTRRFSINGGQPTITKSICAEFCVSEYTFNEFIKGTLKHGNAKLDHLDIKIL